jgi:hypothetical protein
MTSDFGPRFVIACSLAALGFACGSDGSSSSKDSGSNTDSNVSADAPGSCPTTKPTGSDAEGSVSACSSPTNCSYGATCCSCVATPSCGGMILWWCGGTVAPAPCPSTLPSSGDACDARTVGTCEYCTPEGYLQAECGTDGKFTIGPVVGGCAG